VPADAPRAFLEALACLSATVDEAVAQRDSWLERLRAGLVAFLGFFDDRPELGRLLLLDAPTCDGALALRCEQRVLGVLTGLLDDGSSLAAGELMPEPQLVSELVAGGVVAVVRKRMITEPGERLVELAPELMAFVVAPFLGHEAARAELKLRLVAGSPAVREARAILRAIESHPPSGCRVGGEGTGSVCTPRIHREERE
jgi:hypothetical protein